MQIKRLCVLGGRWLSAGDGYADVARCDVPGVTRPVRWTAQLASARLVDGRQVPRPFRCGYGGRVSAAGAGSDLCYSVVRRRKYRDASGVATARISTDQASDASMGCCIGQASIDADGFGLSQSWRAPAVTALTGFQSAMACSQPGMCWVGTMALDTNASGNSTMNPNEAADSGLLLLSPTHAATHDSE